jgi:hypothetical protein
MGVDACVSLRIAENVDAVAWITNDLFAWGAGAYSIEAIGDDMAEYHPKGATHVLVGMYGRYYDDGYERGYWPQLHAPLAVLLAVPGIDTVWYYGDDVDTEGNMDAYTVTPDRLTAITLHYIQERHREWSSAAGGDDE